MGLVDLLTGSWYVSKVAGVDAAAAFCSCCWRMAWSRAYCRRLAKLPSFIIVLLLCAMVCGLLLALLGLTIRIELLGL